VYALIERDLGCYRPRRAGDHRLHVGEGTPPTWACRRARRGYPSRPQLLMATAGWSRWPTRCQPILHLG
jgi:hypothetical protein